MKKNILHIIAAIVLIIFCSGSLFSQSTIRVTVKSGPAGTPVEGAGILIGGDLNGMTDASGNFTGGVASGTNTLGATYGGNTLSKTITFESGDNWMNFWFNPPSLPSDYDDNYYQTITIGSQTWLSKNLVTTHYRNGSNIPYVTNAGTWSSTTTAAYCWYNNNATTYKDTYGALYNWATVNNSNLCPTGYHVPTNDEWTTLVTFLGGELGAGGRLKETGTDHWLSPNTGATNSSGFTALPGGTRMYNDGTFASIGGGGMWWSSTMNLTSAYYLGIRYDASSAINFLGNQHFGMSVRCMKNMIADLTTIPINSVTTTSAQTGGNITYDGGAPVTARGVCWSTLPNPTISNSHTIDGTGIGSFTSSISGLVSSTTYYVRAYATNSEGTSYGNSESFTTCAVPPTIVTITHPTCALVTGSVVLSGLPASGTWTLTRNPDLVITTGTGTTTTITGIPAGTYIFTVTNASGCTSVASSNVVLNAQPATPITSSSAATDIGSAFATLHGTVNANNTIAVITFEYGPTPAFGSSINAIPSPVTGTNPTAVSSNLTGLTANTTYYYRVKADGSGCTNYGNDLSFTTDKEYQLEYISGNNQTYPGGGMPFPLVFKIRNITDNVYVTNLAGEGLSILATAPSGHQDAAFNNLSDYCGEGINSPCFGGYYYVEPNHSSPYVLSITVTLEKDDQAVSIYTITENISGTSANIVTNVSDSGPGSLRNAIVYANSTVGIKDTITFNIPGTGPFTIQPLTPLPPITDPVIIDGYSQPGAMQASDTEPASILIEIAGNASDNTTGLVLSAGNSTISGLSIRSFRWNLTLSENGNNTLKGNYITGMNGTRGNIVITSSDNEIGGRSPAARNVITLAEAGNGIEINNTTGYVTARNKIIGNYIGVDPTGEIRRGNDFAGVAIVSSPDNIIGGPNENERNVISGNTTGISIILAAATGNRIEGNYIGTNAVGTKGIGNDNGIIINAPGNFIGGSTPGAGNLISGNGGPGGGIVIELGHGADGSTIQGNLIGTDRTGFNAIPNNLGAAISIEGGKNNQIGGLTQNAINIISGNGENGIQIRGIAEDHAVGNKIQGNYIGTDISSKGDIGNGSNGIVFGNYAYNNLIGGTEPGAGNLIAFNEGDGVSVGGTGIDDTGNSILSNSIHSNGGLGIDLGNNGVTPNDNNDADIGPNNLQNFPVIDSLNYTSSSVYIKGRLNSTANSQFTLGFFANKVADNTGYGEGRSYLGSKTVTTNSSGTVSFSETFSRSTGWGDVITSTATDASGNTSEFSEAVGGLSDQIIAAASWPFHFRVNEDGILRITNGSDLTAVRQSFATWENITTANIDFVDDGTTALRNASATDGINLVSFTDEKFPFPPRVLAMAAKTLQVSPTDDVARIIDADIVVNPEFSALSVGVGNGNYYDAQSIITHEIGHVMGLLHTGVVNSTMFFMLGYGTKVQSLEQDDRSWASYKYPGASYNSTYGSISGHISYGYGGYPVAGTLVMAIRTGVANPDTIHAYSDAEGNFLVPGVPVGTYNIFIQPLDGSVNGFNLRPGNVSVYIYCNTIYTDYPGEFLSTDESGSETTDTPSPVSVSAGSNTVTGEITTNRDITPPALIKVRPTDPEGDKIKVLSNFIIKFTEPVSESTLTDQTCYLELSTTSGPKQFGGTFSLLPDSLNIIVFNPDSVLRFSKTYSLHLTSGIQDLKGNGLTVPAPVSFTTVDRDLIPPTIKGTYPSSTSENVLVASNVKVMFSEPMSTESVPDNFALTWVGGTPAITNKVDGSITWDAEKATLTFTPSQSLGEATDFTITVSPGATDLSGNHMAAVNNFTFSTVDVAAPVVKYLGPTNSQTGVTIETPVVADFSEAIDPLSVTSSTFSLRLTGSQASISGDFEFLNGNARVVFRPAANLTPGAGYTITLTTGIKDVSPTVNNLLTNITSVFTTAPTPAAPTITFLDPPRGTVKVGTATAVTISGTGFDPSPSKNLILFNGITAFAKTATLNTLTTEVPIGTMSGPVTVTVNGRTSNQMQFDIIPDYMNDPDYTTSNKSLPSGNTGGSAVSGSGEAVFAMVTNPENNSITRIGLGTSGTSSTFQTGGLYPVKVDIDQLGKYAYVTNYYSHDVSVIDLGTNKVSKIIPAGVGPFGVAVTSDGKRVYVSNYESGNLSLIDVDPTSGGFDHVVANVPTGTNPGNIAVTGDAGMVLVTGPFGLKIVSSDPKSDTYNSVVATVSSGTQTKDVTVTADAGFAIVATTEGSLLIINLHPENDDYSGAVVASVPTGTTVSDVKASGDAVYVYATDTENNQILVYKFSGGATGLPSGSGTQGITLIPLDPIPVPDAPTGLNISPAGDKIYTITSLTSTTRQVTTVSLTGGIISPEQSIQGLISTIQIMMDNGNIPRLRGAALIVTLNSALRNIAAGRTKLAILDLNAFVALVNTYIKNKQVSNTQGKALIDVANVVISQLKGTKSGVEEFNYTDVEQPVPEPVVLTKLGVIYPNPSRDAVTISYEIAENEKGTEKVMIQVYDVIGRLVSNLVNKDQTQGRYNATWNGYSDGGEMASRGFYFIRFSAGNVREVKQIMLVR